MFARLTPLLFVAATAAIQAQSLPGAPVHPVTPRSITLLPLVPRPGGVLLGEVVGAPDGAGVPRALVRVTGPGLSLTRLTDQRGRFSFVNLPDADVIVTATKAGFLDGAYGRERADGAPVPLSVWNGQWITGVRIPLLEGASISGIVDDDDVEPAAGVRVRAWRRVMAEGRTQLVPAGDAETNDAGEYRLFGLAPGEYLVSVPSVQVTVPAAVAGDPATPVAPDVAAIAGVTGAHDASDLFVDGRGRYVLLAGRNATAPPPTPTESYAFQTEFYPGVERPDQALPIALGPGEQRLAVHFQLRAVPAHAISGVVVGPDGPRSGQLLRLIADGADDAGLGTETAATVTGAGGGFTLLDVPAGAYTLHAMSLDAVPGVNPAADSARPSADANAPALGATGSVPVAVYDADVGDVIVTVQRAATISGRVALDGQDPPPPEDALAGMTLELLPESRAIGGAVVAAIDRSLDFSFHGLAPGAYYLRVGAPPPGWFVASIRAGNRDLLNQPIILGLGLGPGPGPGDDASDVVVTLTARPSSVRGTVRDWRGIVVSGATVLALPARAADVDEMNPDRLREVRAATSGVFALDGLPAGDYDLVALADPVGDNWQDPAWIDTLRPRAVRVSVKDAERQTIDLRVPRK